MMSRQYHYFIAGLPDLHFGEFKEWTTLPSFYRTLRRELHPLDYQQVSLVLLKEDHEHLLNFLQTGEIHQAKHGNFTLDELREQISLFSAILPTDDILPPYMVNVLKQHEEREGEPDFVQYSHELATGYYHHIMQHGSAFLKTYTRFDYDMNNLLAFLKAREYGLDPKRFITGNSGLAAHLLQSSEKIITVDPEFEWFEELSAIACISPFADAELKMDQLRWKVIDDLVFFEEFSIDWILGYLKKMLIVARWAHLDATSGEKKLRKLTEKSVHTFHMESEPDENVS